MAGNIPETLGNLHKLERLDLSDSDLWGKFLVFSFKFFFLCFLEYNALRKVNDKITGPRLRCECDVQTSCRSSYLLFVLLLYDSTAAIKHCAQAIIHPMYFLSSR